MPSFSFSRALRRAGALASLILVSLAFAALAAGRSLPGERLASGPTDPVLPLPPHELSAPPVASASAPPEPSAHRPRILVLGDSILFGGFGLALDTRLRERGDVWLYGSCGASSMSFLRGVRSECGAVRYEPGQTRERVTGPAPTPRVDPLLASVHPDAALLVLGTNFLCCAAEAAADVRALVDRLVEARVPCLWVGVPSFKSPPSRAVTRHYAMLEEAIGERCSVLDARSLGITFRDVGDRVHVEPVSGQQWADAVARSSFWQQPSLASPVARLASPPNPLSSFVERGKRRAKP